MQYLHSNLRFRQRNKLKTDEISSVFNFRHRENGEFLHLLIKPNNRNLTGLAVLVSKKVARFAVERNYCKRVLRELFRIHQHQFDSLDMVIQVRKKFSRHQYDKVAGEFDLLASKIVRSH